ncbi:MAG: hypothetical protein K6D38_09695 [Pseudobutyrivibrio sp.]|nr:hypothetical protein [Pseudobutyrivibrio sp.]
MNILYRAIWLADIMDIVPPGMTNNLDMQTNARFNEAAMTTTQDAGPVFLKSLYKWAFTLFDNLVQMVEFPNVTEEGVILQDGGSSIEGFQVQWYRLWLAVKDCFEMLQCFIIPIATIFFIIAIFKSVTSKPADEQAKELLFNVLRFVAIALISTKLFDIIEWVVKLTEAITDAVYLRPTIGRDFFDNGLNTIYDAISKYSTPTLKDLVKGEILAFCESIFMYVIYFLGGLATMVIFIKSGFSIVSAAVERIVKPLLMIPFSTIIIGMGVCSGEGERTVRNFFKCLLEYCLSGIFIVVALRLGAKLTAMDLFNINASGEIPDIVKAIYALFRINLPIVITSGLVKSADSFMDKAIG